MPQFPHLGNELRSLFQWPSHTCLLPTHQSSCLGRREQGLGELEGTGRRKRGCIGQTHWGSGDLCQLMVRWNQTPSKNLWRPQVPQGGCQAAFLNPESEEGAPDPHSGGSYFLQGFQSCHICWRWELGGPVGQGLAKQLLRGVAVAFGGSKAPFPS